MFIVYKICPHTDAATELTHIDSNKPAVLSWLSSRQGISRTEVIKQLHRTGKGNYTFGNYTFIKR